MLPFFVEHVLLLVVHPFDREAVGREFGVDCIQPRTVANGIRRSSGVNHDFASAALAKRICTR